MMLILTVLSLFLLSALPVTLWKLPDSVAFSHLDVIVIGRSKEKYLEGLDYVEKILKCWNTYYKIKYLIF